MQPPARIIATHHAIDRYIERVDAGAGRHEAERRIREAFAFSEELRGDDWRRSVRDDDLGDQATNHRLYRPLNLILVTRRSKASVIVMTVFLLKPSRGKRNKGTRSANVKQKLRGVEKCRARRRELLLLRMRELSEDA